MDHPTCNGEIEMKSNSSSRSDLRTSQKSAANGSVSRRKLLKTGAAAVVGGGAATLLGGAAAVAAAQTAQEPARRGGVTGRKYRALVRTKTAGAALQEVTLL